MMETHITTHITVPGQKKGPATQIVARPGLHDTRPEGFEPPTT